LALYIVAQLVVGPLRSEYRDMTDAELWRLTVEIVVLAVLGGGYLYARYLPRKFGREFGGNRTPGE
jgi:hypothetical protein